MDVISYLLIPNTISYARENEFQPHSFCENTGKISFFKFEIYFHGPP